MLIVLLIGLSRNRAKGCKTRTRNTLSLVLIPKVLFLSTPSWRRFVSPSNRPNKPSKLIELSREQIIKGMLANQLRLQTKSPVLTLQTVISQLEARRRLTWASVRASDTTIWRAIDRWPRRANATWRRNKPKCVRSVKKPDSVSPSLALYRMTISWRAARVSSRRCSHS